MSAAGPTALAAELLGRHVVDGAEPLARPRSGRRRRDLARDAEVGQVGVLALVQQDVAGLTSRWTRPCACAAPSAEATWATSRRRALASSGACGGEQLGEARPAHEAHRDEQQAAVLARFVDRDHVWVLERRRRRATRARSARGTRHRRRAPGRSASARPVARASAEPPRRRRPCRRGRSATTSR